MAALLLATFYAAMAGVALIVELHMPPLRASGDRTNAGGRLPVLLRLQRLRATPQAEARGLLRVLFVRLGAVPADASGTAPPLSTKVADVDGDGKAAPRMVGEDVLMAWRPGWTAPCAGCCRRS